MKGERKVSRAFKPKTAHRGARERHVCLFQHLVIRRFSSIGCHQRYENNLFFWGARISRTSTNLLSLMKR